MQQTGFVKIKSNKRDVTHLLDEHHHALLQTDQFLRHPLGLVQQHVRSMVVAIQRHLQVNQRFDPRLDQHQHRMQQPFILQKNMWWHENKSTDHRLFLKNLILFKKKNEIHKKNILTIYHNIYFFQSLKIRFKSKKICFFATLKTP